VQELFAPRLSQPLVHEATEPVNEVRHTRLRN
jgi:hypothetical protein